MIDEFLNQYNKFIELLTSSGYGLCFTDHNFKILWMNDTFKKWFGNAVISLTIFKVIEEVENQEDSKIVQAIIENIPLNIEVQNPSTKRWFFISSTKIHGDSDKRNVFLFFIDDTTERKIIFEHYISQLEILDNVEDGIYSTDFNNKIIYWNKGAEKIYGYSANDVIGKQINLDFKLFDPIDIETQVQLTQELEKYRSYSFKRKEYRKDGFEIWIEGNVSLICDTGDNPVGLLYIVRDVTGKLISDLLNSTNASLQKALREITAGLISDFSLKDITIQFTKRCKDLTESNVCIIIKATEHTSEIIELMSEMDYSQTTLEELKQHAFAIRSWLELNKKIFNSDEQQASEITALVLNILGVNKIIIAPVIIKNDIPYFILIGAKEYFLSKFKIEILQSFASFFAFIISYFDNKLLQQNLIENLQRAKKFELTSNLISGIVHDFKNLLNGIQAVINNVKQKQKQENLHDFINEIETLLKRGIDLSKTLLEVGKPIKPQKSQFKVYKLIEEVYKFAKNICPRNIEVIKKCDNELPDLYADYGQIHQVLINLIVNAKDAMPDGGKLIITVDRISVSEKDYLFNPSIKPGNYVSICIEDTGIGIPSEQLQKIFEPYYTTKDKQHGTGLGLFIAQNIINRHNGIIQVESELGKGTKFKVILPTIEQQVQPQLKMKKQILSSNPTILLVDDEVNIRSLLSEMLSYQNFKVIESASGSEAKDLFVQNKDKIDLVILDYFLSDTTGAEVLKYIREIDEDIPVLIATGIVDENILEKLKELKVSRIIEKPYEFETLIETLKNFLQIEST